MSLSPMLPGSSDLKSFWKRPEGKAGMIVLGALGLGALAAWGVIVPYVVSMLEDTVHMAILGAELAGIGYLIFGKRPRLMYRLIMRAITGIFIELDPIGILKDNRLQAKKKQELLNANVGRVSGAKQTLRDIMTKNKATIQQDLSLAEVAKRKMDSATDQTLKLRMQYEMKLRTNEIGRLQKSDENYEKILDRVTNCYDTLVKLSAGVDFFIADLDGTIREAEINKRVVDSTWQAFSTALAIIKGSADEQDLYNQTLESLADDSSMKLGQIDDMTRLSQHFLDSVDLQNGVMDAGASAALESYEQKLLTSGDQKTVSLLTGGGSIPEKVVAPIAGAVDYGDFFNKK